MRSRVYAAVGGFINEIAVLCEEVGADPSGLTRLKTERRIGRGPFVPGGAFAGARGARRRVPRGSRGHDACGRRARGVAEHSHHKDWVRRALTGRGDLRGRASRVGPDLHRDDTLRRSASVALRGWPRRERRCPSIRQSAPCPRLRSGRAYPPDARRGVGPARSRRDEWPHFGASRQTPRHEMRSALGAMQRSGRVFCDDPRSVLPSAGTEAFPKSQRQEANSKRAPKNQECALADGPSWCRSEPDSGSRSPGIRTGRASCALARATGQLEPRGSIRPTPARQIVARGRRMYSGPRCRGPSRAGAHRFQQLQSSSTRGVSPHRSSESVTGTPGPRDEITLRIGAAASAVVPTSSAQYGRSCSFGAAHQSLRGSRRTRVKRRDPLREALALELEEFGIDVTRCTRGLHEDDERVIEGPRSPGEGPASTSAWSRRSSRGTPSRGAAPRCSRLRGERRITGRLMSAVWDPWRSCRVSRARDRPNSTRYGGHTAVVLFFLQMGPA